MELIKRLKDAYSITSSERRELNKALVEQALNNFDLFQAYVKTGTLLD